MNTQDGSTRVALAAEGFGNRKCFTEPLQSEVSVHLLISLSYNRRYICRELLTFNIVVSSRCTCKMCKYTVNVDIAA